MRVLHLGAGNMFGGIETLLVTMARERRLCPDLKPHFTVCFEGRLSRELRATGAPVDYLGNVRVRNPFTILRARAALDRLLSQEHFDAAICHGPWVHAIFGTVIKARRLPLILWAHGFYSGRHWLEIWAKLTLPDLLVCNSFSTRETVSKLFPECPSQVLYCPASTRSANRAWDPPSQPVVIVQVSRMEKWKGQTVLLSALRKLKDTPDWICWFAGGASSAREADYQTSLKLLAAEYGLEDRVEFLGETHDIWDLLARSDIFCQPNLTPEPFGIVFLEALQTMLPVVSSRLGGAAEIVDDTCGILVPANEPALLADALRNLILDPSRRRLLGSAGPARVQFLCDPARQLNRLRELLSAF